MVPLAAGLSPRYRPGITNIEGLQCRWTRLDGRRHRGTSSRVTNATPQQRLKDGVARIANTVHRTVFNTTNGRLAGDVFGMPVVKLTTTGRRSGRKRPTMLTSPVHDDDRVVLVASYGGDDRHPAWYLNLKANPQVEVVMQGQRRTMRARTATPEERSELWPKVTASYKGYGQYQTRTDREIPLVILEPAPQPA